MSNRLGCSVCIAALALAVVACGGTASSGAPGHSSLMAFFTEPAGSHCAAGGQRVAYGVDDDGDGALQASEFDGVSYLCNGISGTPGGSGADGVDGSRGLPGADGLLALISTRVVVSGDPHCPAGGFEIGTGVDANLNGALDPSEVQSSAYVCHGTAGATGPAGADGRDGRDGVNGQNGTGSADGRDGRDGRDGVDGKDGANGYSSLISVTPASPGANASIDFESDPPAEGQVRHVDVAPGYVLEFIATDTLGSLVDNGSGWTWSFCDVNGFHHSAVLRPADTSTRYYVLHVRGDVGVSWKGIQLLDEGDFDTANVTFYAFRHGVELGSEVRTGDIPWAGVSGAVSYTFAGRFFADADTIVIAPRRADGVSVTPLALDNVEVSLGAECAHGGQKVQAGLDNGANDGTARDGVLQSGEVTSTAFICAP